MPKRKEKTCEDDDTFRCCICKKKKSSIHEGMGYKGGIMCKECMEKGW